MPDELHGNFIGGSELSLGDNLALRAEYLFSNYQGDNSASRLDTNCSWWQSLCFQNLNRHRIDLDFHTIRAALVFKLGAPKGRDSRHDTATLEVLFVNN